MGHIHDDTHPAQTDLGVDPHHRRATRFLWMMLAGATLISVTGNAIHAWYSAVSLPHPWAAAVATVPPLALLCLCEAFSLMSRTNTVNTATHRIALVVTACLAIVAFALSFDALRDLALRAGVRESLAWLWPITVDATIGQATLSLLALSRTPTPVLATQNDPAVSATTAPEAPEEHVGSLSVSVAAPAQQVPVQAAAVEPATTSAQSRAAAGSNQSDMRLAAEAAIEAGITTLPVEIVTEVFERHSEGANANQIAKAVSKPRSTVSRLIERSTTTLVDFNLTHVAASAP